MQIMFMVCGKFGHDLFIGLKLIGNLKTECLQHLITYLKKKKIELNVVLINVKET